VLWVPSPTMGQRARGSGSLVSSCIMACTIILHNHDVPLMGSSSLAACTTGMIPYMVADLMAGPLCVEWIVLRACHPLGPYIFHGHTPGMWLLVPFRLHSGGSPSTRRFRKPR
jgi:hypothetical protein